MTTREIKFRAWNGALMFYDDLTVVGPDIGLNNLLRKTGMLFTLMQYTGLKDKNGKEIYEGDIVQPLPSGYEPREVFKVIWDESEARFCAMFRDSLNRNWELKRHIIDLQHMKVIGNIYENPNLLNP